MYVIQKKTTLQQILELWVAKSYCNKIFRDNLILYIRFSMFLEIDQVTPRL